MGIPTAVLASALALLTIGLIGHKKAPCENISYSNGGSHAYGNSNCLLPREGVCCQTDARTKFVGNWTGKRRCTNSLGAVKIKLKISLLGKDSLEIAIPGEINSTLRAKLMSDTTFAIPSQRVRVGILSVSAEGQGSWQNERLLVEVRYSSGVSCRYENLSK